MSAAADILTPDTPEAERATERRMADVEIAATLRLAADGYATSAQRAADRGDAEMARRLGHRLERVLDLEMRLLGKSVRYEPRLGRREGEA